MIAITRPALLSAVAAILFFSTASDSSAQGSPARSLPRLYVFTQVAKPGTPAAPDQEARLGSTKSLQEELRKKPRLLEVVDSSDKADVTVEVLSRESPSPTSCTLTVRVRAAARGFTRQFQGESRTCTDAAVMVAGIIVRWVNESYDRPAPE
jgi:hypothetical protein